MPPVRLTLPATVLVGAVIAMAQPSPHAERATVNTGAPSHAALLGDGSGMRLLRISIGPGAGLPWRNGSPPLGGYVVKGDLRLPVAAGRRPPVCPGDALADHPEVVRRGHAGPEGATILVYYANEA